MTKDQDRLFAQVMTILNIAGLNPTQKNYYSNYRAYFVLINLIYQFVMATCEILLNFKGVETLARYSEVAVIMWMSIWRIIFLISNHKKLSKIIKSTYNFWPIDHLGDSYTKEVNFPVFTAGFLFQSLMGIVSVIGTLYSSLPLLSHTNALPWMCYGDSKSSYFLNYWFMYGLQLLAIFLLASSSLSFMGLLLYLLGVAHAEGRMINLYFSNERFKNLKLDFSERFDEATQHHIRLLRFVNDVRDSYSFILLNEYLSSQMAVCMSLFLMVKIGSPLDLTLLLKYLVLLCAYSSQISIFCLLGNNLAYDLGCIPVTLFHSNWHSHFDNRKKRNILFVIERGQLDDSISIGGFWKLNMISLNKLIRQALSFLACLQAMDSRKM